LEVEQEKAQGVHAGQEHGHGATKEGGVVADILDGCVDLVGYAGRQRTDGFQLLGVTQLDFHLLALPFGRLALGDIP
jgi:hypothetical protein